MNLNRKNIRKIRGLILFTAVVILAIMKFDLLCEAVMFCMGILKPFLLGGMIAFVINIPMSFFERKLFGDDRIKPGRGKLIRKCRRGISLVLALLAVVLVIVLVAIAVIPQLVETVRVLAEKIPIFWAGVLERLEVLFAERPELLQYLQSLEEMQIDWKKIIDTVMSF